MSGTDGASADTGIPSRTAADVEAASIATTNVGDMGTRALIIDDDEALSAMLAEYLSERGLEVIARPCARDGLRALAEASPEAPIDAVILDVMLPDHDGFEVCRRIRESSDVPILMLTARGEETDRIVGLEIGADDYLAKPFNPRELLARLNAVLRRSRSPVPNAAEGPPGKARLVFGRLEIDRDARVVSLDGEPRRLTAHQFELLCLLAENAGRVLTRDQIMQGLRGQALEAFDRSIDNHVSRIRAAIEDDPRRPKRLLTVRGTGYVFARDHGDER